MTGVPALEVADLTVMAGGAPLVDGVGFSVLAGQRMGIIGASGSGKTLACLALAGLLPPGLTATGSVRLAGVELLGASEPALAAARARALAFVFQEPMTALDPTMRVDRQVAESLRARGHPAGRAERRQYATRLLAEVGIADPRRVARAFPHQLSGGQRQRVVLAMALAHEPDVLICDEPTTALDVSVQARVLAVIDRQIAARAAALLFVSHDLAVVAAVCDEVVVMWRGRIVERGPVVAVLSRPRHEYTRQLVAHAQVAPRAPEVTS